MVAGSAPTGAAAAGGRTSVACGGGRAEQDLLSGGNPMDNSDLSTGEDLSEEEADPVTSGSPTAEATAIQMTGGAYGRRRPRNPTKRQRILSAHV